ncbi:Eco57I restriction-modification methylase domain-containing protein [Pseudarthrobacter sp. C1]|uniref:Eco57I restriction-modification methylase domain-containing protein n=1 Tax=Pseudarthrobacter sp. C1 TaxID=3108940 RepID=UPI002B05CB74|nr:hypothetical protein [Pseudarthrobacter sp. C1]MEA3549235.1 hypothetical protein [Pseudarthrobacter sp. C1]
MSVEQAQLEAALESFLSEHERTVEWQLPGGSSVIPDLVFLGNGADALEVLLAQTSSKPTKAAVEHLWKARWNRRAAPVLLVAAYPSSKGVKASVYGLGEDAAFVPELDLEVAEAIARLGLNSGDSIQAARAIQERLSSLDSEHHGLWNSGLFSTYALTKNAPKLGGWAEANRRAESARTKSGRDLLKALGWATEEIGSTGTLLKSGETLTAVAILLQSNETFERTSSRFNSASPVAHGLTEAKKRGLKWVVVANDSVLRLYSTDPGVGVGRKGETETFTQVDLALLGKDEGAYLPLLFSPEALSVGGSVGTLLVSSTEHASSVGDRLRQRVYEHVVPVLAQAVARRLDAKTPAQLEDAYHHSMIVLFRLLFIAYAEDGDLLPYRTDARYNAKSLKQLAQVLSSRMSEGALTFDHHATDLWDDQVAVWAAIDSGNDDLGVPAYNGGLFRDDAVARVSGSRLSDLRLTNGEFGPALAALLVDGHELGPVDFRDLSVREFGTIYEGLLESSLSLAESNLIVDKNGSYIPAADGQATVVEAGQVYLHNSSGARKTTGSYFTKPFAVDHLLRTALEPTLREHLDRVRELLKANDDAGAAALFFDFRVADIAMGSGHFLVAAVDHMESIMSAFLVEHPIPMVDQELDKLGQSAKESLGAHAGLHEIERASLLRRQIAKRCIYGVDINEIAVELARVALWIHTFVPGLPMSSLDHSLVAGNSLTGIGTLEEGLGIFEPQRVPGQYSLFADQLESSVALAKVHLTRLGLVAEATIDEANEAHALYAEALEKAEPARQLLDAAVAVRLGWLSNEADPHSISARAQQSDIAKRLGELRPVHFAAQFPEVFMRDDSGFDVLLGNPPWEELQAEEIKFWNREIKGLKGKPPAQQKKMIAELRTERPAMVVQYEKERATANAMRPVLMAGPFPGLGTGDLDLYRVFCWRQWQLLRTRGRTGVVLPRTALQADGSALWRKEVLTEGSFDRILVLTNSKNWVFDEVEGRYSVVLAVTRKGPSEVGVRFGGPFYSLDEFEQYAEDLQEIGAEEFASWTKNYAFPLFPTSESAATFRKLRSSDRFDLQSGYRAVTEFHATNDRKTFDGGERRPGSIPVFTGRSFDIWNPDTGTYYAWADPHVVEVALQRKRLNQVRNKRTAFYGADPAWVADATTLPMHRPRLVFRDITNATNSRTVLVALIPGEVVLTNKAPWLYAPKAEPKLDAWTLGIMSSIPFDWYARRFVELSLNIHLLNSFPVPKFDETSALTPRVIENAARLAAVDDRFSAWAASAGVPVGSVTSQIEKEELVAELDALVSLLYGLDRDDVVHIFETFHRGWNYTERLNAVLRHFDSWKDQA